MTGARPADLQLPPLRSVVEGIGWPALPGMSGAALLAQLYQLEESQWWSPDELARRQFDQLGLVVKHARRHSPFYRERLGAAGLYSLTAWSPESLARMPLLGRADLLLHAQDIFTRQFPREHGAASEKKSSGSTGRPVVVRRTALNDLYNMSLTLRDHIWHRRDFRRTLAVTRPMVAVCDDPETAARNGWGPPVSLLFQSGPGYVRPMESDVARQAEWLADLNPGYLLTFPNNLSALLDCFELSGRYPAGLKGVRTIGETLPDGLRRRCHAVLGVDIVDLFSSEEAGTIALQCPETGLYHVQAESLLLEVLDEDGKACAPGMTGRIVLTDLHNFATPLIRYDTGDYAEVGPPCPCGRGLPTLARILGRQRNMLVLPDGTRHWPVVGSYHYREAAPVLQFQVLQHALDDIEVRLAVERALTVEEEGRLKAIIQRALAHEFPLRFAYFDRELPDKGAKFEEFISYVA